jgi:hypothetical protein
MSDERERNIRDRAYAIWEKEGRPDGKSLEHWLQAEAEIGNEKVIGVTNDGKILRSSGSGVASATERSLRRYRNAIAAQVPMRHAPDL